MLQDLITNGVTALGTPYALLKKFQENFNPETKNSAESVFAVQNSVNDGSGGWNGNLGDLNNFPWNIGYGFFQPSQWLVNHFKTNAQSGLPDFDHFNDTDVKNDEGLQSADPFVPDTGKLDPRLDWTVGRRGIPYLDWGIHQGKDWIRNQQYAGPYSPIKNIYKKSQQEQFSDASFWTPTSTATNINLIRYADILLWAAETEIEIGSLAKATDYINQIEDEWKIVPAGCILMLIQPIPTWIY